MATSSESPPGGLPPIPHRPPWLLVDRVTGTDPAAGRVTATKLLSHNDPLVGDGLADVYVVEALAQTAACLESAERGAHQGMLVAVSGFRFASRARAGETLTLEATRRATMGALHRFSCRASVDERLVGEGELTFAVEPATRS